MMQSETDVVQTSSEEGEAGDVCVGNEYKPQHDENELRNFSSLSRKDCERFSSSS